MEVELAACPMPGCGKPVEVTSAEYANTYDDFVLCTEDHCPYSATVDQHAILTRRAEIGALVERIVAGGCLRLYEYGCESEGFSYGATNRLHATTTGKDAGGKTLLDALRSLAAEIGGER